MVFKPDQQKMQQLLSEAITVLCKNGLNYQSHVNVEALIGITLDDDEVFLVSVRETIQNMKQHVPTASPTFSVSPAATQRVRAISNRKRPASNTFLPQQTEQVTVEPGSQNLDEPNEPPSKRLDDGADVIHIKGEQSDEETGSAIVEQASIEQDEVCAEPPDDGGGGADEADAYGSNQLEQFVDFATTSQSSDISQVDSKAAIFANQAAINQPMPDPAFPMTSQSLVSPSHQQIKAPSRGSQQVGTYFHIY